MTEKLILMHENTPYFIFFPFLKPLGGQSLPAPPPMAPPLCVGPISNSQQHIPNKTNLESHPLSNALCVLITSLRNAWPNKTKTKTKTKQKQKKTKPMICPGVYYVHVCTSLLIHSTKALCGKWPWWMSIQELLFRSHLSCMTAYTEYHDLLDLIYQSI